jgi:hypothetical protein
MMRIISEPEFQNALKTAIASIDCSNVGSVTGPGRSGAVAAVYASHLLGVPFIPYGSDVPVRLGRLLVVDTARESGKTIRKTLKRYEYANPIAVVAFEEPPRVAFWYEASKPQRYRHERKAA